MRHAQLNGVPPLSLIVVRLFSPASGCGPFFLFCARTGLLAIKWLQTALPAFVPHPVVYPNTPPRSAVPHFTSLGKQTLNRASASLTHPWYPSAGRRKRGREQHRPPFPLGFRLQLMYCMSNTEGNFLLQWLTEQADGSQYTPATTHSYSDRHRGGGLGRHWIADWAWAWISALLALAYLVPYELTSILSTACEPIVRRRTRRTLSSEESPNIQPVGPSITRHSTAWDAIASRRASNKRKVSRPPGPDVTTATAP